MKIGNRGFAVIAGLLLLVFAAFVWWKGFPSNYILLIQIVLVGLALTATFMAVPAVINSRRENSIKIGDKGFALIAGLLLLVAAGVIWRFGFPNMDQDYKGNQDYMILSQIVLVGLALTVVFMAILAIIYSVMGVEDGKQALGLPDGSVRALLAFSLVLIFVCLAAFLFGEVNKNNQPVEGKTLDLVTETQLADLKASFNVASGLAKDQSGQVRYEQVAGKDGTPTNDLKHPLYTVTYYPKGNKDAEDFAKQIFTTLATVFVSVVSFYFGSSVTTSAAAAGAKAAQGPDGKPSAALQSALTNALADSHNAQAALDKASQALDAAKKDAQEHPGDPQKQAALQSAQKALDDAKQDLQDKQNKVAAAQKAVSDADPKAPKPSAGQNA